MNKSDLPELVRFTQKTDIIGLDFGTSTLAVSYMTSASDKIHKFRICSVDADFYTPTVLLFDENKVEIGSRALINYTKLQHNVSKSTFFERVKLELQHDKVNLLHNIC